MRKIIIAIVALTVLLGACSDKSAFDLEVGDCFDDPSSFEEVESVPIKECADPHDNEVYANSTMSGTSWPGVAAVEEFADEACYTEFERYVGIAYEDSLLEFGWLVPTEASWAEVDDRTVTCIVYNLDLSKMTGSMQGVAF